GVGTLSELAVLPEDRLKLFDEVVTQTGRVLDSESHERTICVALEALNSWIQSLDTPLPEKILQIYKKGLSAKSTTQTVGIAYTSLISRALRRGPAAGRGRQSRAATVAGELIQMGCSLDKMNYDQHFYLMTFMKIAQAWLAFAFGDGFSLTIRWAICLVHLLFTL
ncbi:jg628, partial [Pararge aegeria aegeria]